MDGENNGKTPHEKMVDLGGQKPSYFWRDGPLKNFFVEAMVPVPPPAEAGSVAEEGRFVWLSDHLDWMHDLEG